MSRVIQNKLKEFPYNLRLDSLTSRQGTKKTFLISVNSLPS